MFSLRTFAGARFAERSTANLNECLNNKKYENPSITNEITLNRTKLWKPLIYIKQIVTHRRLLCNTLSLELENKFTDFTAKEGTITKMNDIAEVDNVNA